MPLRAISGADAINNLRSNPYADWPGREPADANRIEPYCTPAFSPSFNLEPGEKIFTIGSCFARNIEGALAKRGFEVATASLDWPDKSVDVNAQGVLNNYGVVSIENEFRWALDPAHPFDPARHILEVAPGRYLDPHLWVRAESLGKMMMYRSAVTAVTRQVRDCRVVIMTLGLSELWYDTLTHAYLNRPPPRMMVSRVPERFELHVLTFEETLHSLSSVVRLLRTHCREDQRILLTVSPVPLMATHTDQDVIVINSYSKSVLRTVAEHIAAAHPHIDYFPSYESVMLSDHARAWQDDQIHVRDSLIQLNIERMIEAYVPGAAKAAVNAKLILRDANEELAAGNPEGALRTLAPLRNAGELEADFATDYAELCLALGRRDDAWAALDKLPASAPPWRRKMVEAQITIHDGQAEEGIAALVDLSDRLPKNQAVPRGLTLSLMRLQRWPDALRAARRWSEVARGPAPLLRAAQIHKELGDMEAAERAFRQMLGIPGVQDMQVLDYIEFLIGRGRLADAAREIAFIRPESVPMLNWLERLKPFLPVERATA